MIDQCQQDTNYSIATKMFLVLLHTFLENGLLLMWPHFTLSYMNLQSLILHFLMQMRKEYIKLLESHII